MSAITTMDQLLAALQNPVPIYKSSLANSAAGAYQSLWTATGFPTAGATPSSGVGQTNTSSTQGALRVPDLSTGQTLYLARASITMATAGVLTIYDRLVSTSGLSGIVTSAQTVNSTALPRYTDGVGVEAFLEFYGAVGATASVPTVSYTNSDATSGRSFVGASIASTPIARMIPIVPIAGDKGIRSVESVTLSASSGTAGNFGVTLMKRLMDIPVTLGNTGVIVDPFGMGIPDLANYGDSQPCLAFMVFCSTTSTGVVTGSINTAVY